MKHGVKHDDNNQCRRSPRLTGANVSRRKNRLTQEFPSLSLWESREEDVGNNFEGWWLNS